ncbi:YfhO family protein [Christensenella timonensis]|uniref:YfhO family protein n=1 Tax=Christensenella timonensis TaxID=1816678 RepID=UPI0013905163|nr:YfhO family protein [Christensenella timonensis]
MEKTVLQQQNNPFIKYRMECIYIALFLVIPLLLFADALVNHQLIDAGDMVGTFSRNSIVREAFTSGKMTFWNIYEASGTPWISPYLMYPLAWIVMPFDAVTQTTLYFALHLSLGGIFLFFYLKELNLSVHAAFFGGIVFMLSNMLLLRMAHSGVVATMVWTPLVLLLTEKLLKHNAEFKYMLLAGIAVAMQALAGFQQVLIYSCIFVAIYYVACGLHKKIKWYRLIGSLIGAFIVAVCLWAVILLPTFQLIRFTGRAIGDSYEHFASFSFDPRVVVGMLSPEAWRTMNSVAYKGEFTVDIYFGLVVLALCIYALIFCRKNFKVKVLGIGMVLVFLFMICPSVEPIGRLVQKIPFIGSFRCTARAVFLFAICEIALAAIALNQIIRNKEYKRYLKFSILFFIAVCVLLGIFYVNRHEWFNFGIDNKIKMAGVMLLVIAGLNILIAFIIMLLTLKEKRRYLATIFVIALVILNICDVFFMNNAKDFELPERVTRRFDAELLKNTEFSNFMNDNAGLEYRVAKVGGTSHQKNRSMNMYITSETINRYMDLNGYISYENQNYLKMFSNWYDISVYVGTEQRIENLSLYSMLDVKYFAVQDGYGFEVWDIKPADLILEKDIVRIEPGDGERVAWQEEFELQPDHYYFVEATVVDGGNAERLYIDLYAGNSQENDYDHFEHDLDLRGYGEETRRFLINSMKDAPGKASVRLLAQGNSDTVTVKDIRIYDSVAVPVDLPIAAEVEDYGVVENEKKANGNITIYENPYVKGMVYSADYVIGMQTAEQIIADTKTNDFDRNIYVVGHDDMELLESNTKISIESIDPNNVSAKVNADQDTFVVMAQNYYPAWKAYVDGQETQIYIANGTLQGIDVPAGEHIVEFKYIPSYFYAGAVISACTVCFLIIYFVAQSRKKKRTDNGK